MINKMIAFMVAASSESINTSIADGTVDRTALTGICVGMDTSAASPKSLEFSILSRLGITDLPSREFNMKYPCQDLRRRGGLRLPCSSSTASSLAARGADGKLRDHLALARRDAPEWSRWSKL